MARVLAGMLGTVALLAGPIEAYGQDGFALRVGAVFNSTTVEDLETDLRFSDAAGWSLGAEYLLPTGVAVGISGYTGGSPDSFDLSEGSFVVLADANYFLRLPLLPIAPYAGLHVGLGTYRLDEVRDAARPEVDFGDLGFQLGVRFQATSTFGLDAQYRRVSGSLAGQQGGEFQANQFVLGVTLF